MRRFILLLVLLAACGSSGPPPTTAVDSYRFQHGNFQHTVLDVRLDDGTRCVLYRGSGIDCDWAER